LEGSVKCPPEPEPEPEMVLKTSPVRRVLGGMWMVVVVR
jgi:hypothetical protein